MLVGAVGHNYWIAMLLLKIRRYEIAIDEKVTLFCRPFGGEKHLVILG